MVCLYLDNQCNTKPSINTLSVVVNGLSARLRRRNNTCTFAAEKNETDMSKLHNFEKRISYIPIVTTAVLGMALIIFGIVMLAS